MAPILKHDTMEINYKRIIKFITMFAGYSLCSNKLATENWHKCLFFPIKILAYVHGKLMRFYCIGCTVYIFGSFYF